MIIRCPRNLDTLHSAFTYEGLTLLRAETAASTGTTSSVTYLSDSVGRPYGGVYASSETSAVAFGIVTTDRGDVRALTDGAGAAFAFYAFDAYGRPVGTQTQATASLDATQAAAIAGANVLGYAGYAYDAHSGLYYCSARYLDPATASFITKDPAKADGEESAYQYCGGDPVGRVDPSGEWDHTTFHYDVTRRIALGLKVKSEYAALIAAGCRWIDLCYPITSSISPLGYGYHFNSKGPWHLTYDKAHFVPDARDSRRNLAVKHRKSASTLAKIGLLANAAFELGMGLHPLQDAYAHGSLLQHKFGNMPVDNTNTRTPWEVRSGLPRGWRAQRARIATQSYLMEFAYINKLK